MSKLIITPSENKIGDDITITSYGLNFEGYNSFGYVIYSPFGNCQIYSVAQAKEILSYDRKVAIQAFKDIFATVQKNQMIIDIPSSYQGQADEIFKEYVTFRTPYTNTTGSEMIVYLINMKKFYYNEEKIESPNAALLNKLIEKRKQEPIIIQITDDLLYIWNSHEVIRDISYYNNIIVNIISHQKKIEFIQKYIIDMFSQQKCFRFDEDLKAIVINLNKN